MTPLKNRNGSIRRRKRRGKITLLIECRNNDGDHHQIAFSKRRLFPSDSNLRYNCGNMRVRIAILLSLSVAAFGRETLTQRVVHADPAKYRPTKSVHGGPGPLNFMSTLDSRDLATT